MRKSEHKDSNFTILTSTTICFLGSALVTPMIKSFMQYISFYLQVFLLTFVALVFTYILVEAGIFEPIGRLFEPLLKPARLPPETAVPIAMRVFSPTASHGVLAALYKDGKVSSNEIITTVLISQLPSKIYYMFRFYAPFVIPVLGPVLGLYYLALSMIVTLALAGTGLIFGRITGCKPGGEQAIGRVNFRKTEFNSKVLKKGIIKGVKVFLSIAWRMTIAYIIVTILILTDFFEKVSACLAPYISVLFVEPSAVTISIIAAASPLIALPMAGDMFTKGIIGIRDCLTALFLGRLIFTAFNDLPRAIPIFFGMYGTKVGGKLFIVLEIVSAVGNLIAMFLASIL